LEERCFFNVFQLLLEYICSHLVFQSERSVKQHAEM
jgi:hypothetical protein